MYIKFYARYTDVFMVHVLIRFPLLAELTDQKLKAIHSQRSV